MSRKPATVVEIMARLVVGAVIGAVPAAFWAAMVVSWWPFVIVPVTALLCLIFGERVVDRLWNLLRHLV